MDLLKVSLLGSQELTLNRLSELHDKVIPCIGEEGKKGYTQISRDVKPIATRCGNRIDLKMNGGLFAKTRCSVEHLVGRPTSLY